MTAMTRRVTIATPLGESLQFHRLSGIEELSRLYCFDVELFSANNTVDANALLGKSVTLELRTETGIRYLGGLVCDFGLSGEDKRRAFYKMHLRPWLWLATLRSDFRVYQDMSAPEIVEAVLSSYGYPMARKLTREYRRWTYCCQHGESDFEFACRLLEHEGIGFYFRHEAERHVLVFVDDIAASHDPLPGGETIRYHVDRAAGMTGGLAPSERIYEMETTDEVRSGSHIRGDYDPGKPKADLSSQRGASIAHDHSGFRRYEWPGGYTQVEQGEHYASVRMQEQLSERRRITGHSNVRELAPGRTFVLTDHPRADLNQRYLLLRVEYTLEENLQASEGGVGAGGEGSVQRFVFKAQPVSYAWRPARITPKQRTHGPQPALVVGPANEEIWTDELGRIKVQFFWDRRGKKDEHSSCWLRVSAPWAGSTFGMAALPRIGQEVIVDFLHGDPDHPFVVGRWHNADEMPPWKLPDQKHLTGIRSREIGGGSGRSGGGRSNHIALDDSSGRIQLQLKSDHASSSLSLGHIGRIDDTDGRKDDRGQGFEQRTDGHGAIRAAKGLLVTTETRLNAQGHITAMDETLARLTQGRDLHEGMSQSALEAKANDVGDQDSVAQALRDQDEAIRGCGGDPRDGQFPEFQKPHLTLASPAGIQTTTQGSTHIASVDHNALTSGGHTSVATGRSFLVSARNAVRLFAYKAGMRLISASADIDIQALKTSVNVLARLNVKLEAERITITAKEEVLINGGSSYSRWNASGIVHGTQGLWREHAGTHSLVGPDSRTPQTMNRDVMAPFDQEVIFHHLDEESTPAAKQVFALTRDGEPEPPPTQAAASDATGLPGARTDASGTVTGKDGTTKVQRSDGPEVYKIRWLGRKK